MGVVNVRLNDWVREYVEIYKKPVLKVSTYEAYQNYCSNVTCDKELHELTSLDIQKMINYMLSCHKATSTIKHMLTVVRQALKKAKALGMIENLSCLECLELPRQRKKHILAFSDTEQQLIIKNAHRSFYGDLFLALMYSGLRVGEMIALRCKDVDFSENVLHINKTSYRRHDYAPKTADSFRDIPMSRELSAVLKRHYSFLENDYVFKNTLGTVISYRSLLDCWHHFCDIIGIYRMPGLHVLRHTYAANALAAGVNVKVLAELLGHSSVTVTLDIYTDVSMADKRKAVELISSMS